MSSVRSADEYFAGQMQWREEQARLREIVMSTGLTETIKWGGPCYTLDDKLVVGIAGFKHHFALWFHQGATLADTAGKLVNAQQGRTRALRQWRFTAGSEIKPRLIKKYITEAIENQRAGRVIKPNRATPLVIPVELRTALDASDGMRAAFDALNKTRQREYAEYIGDAKREATKSARLAKVIPLIEAGAGLHDKYRS